MHEYGTFCSMPEIQANKEILLLAMDESQNPNAASMTDLFVSTSFLGYFLEAVIEAEIMSNGVLPVDLVTYDLIILELLLYGAVDAVQRQLFFLGLLQYHGYESHIAGQTM